MLVVDASAVADLLLARPPAAMIERHVVDHAYALHAPQLLDIEVLSAIRRVLKAGEASSDRAGAAIAAFLDLPVARYPHETLVPRIWQLRDNFSAYDGVYLALAEALVADGATLLTTDGRFARAIRRHSAVDVLLVD